MPPDTRRRAAARVSAHATAHAAAAAAAARGRRLLRAREGAATCRGSGAPPAQTSATPAPQAPRPRSANRGLVEGPLPRSARTRAPLQHDTQHIHCLYSNREYAARSLRGGRSRDEMSRKNHRGYADQLQCLTAEYSDEIGHVALLPHDEHTLEQIHSRMHNTQFPDAMDLARCNRVVTKQVGLSKCLQYTIPMQQHPSNDKDLEVNSSSKENVRSNQEKRSKHANKRRTRKCSGDTRCVSAAIDDAKRQQPKEIDEGNEHLNTADEANNTQRQRNRDETDQQRKHKEHGEHSKQTEGLNSNRLLKGMEFLKRMKHMRRMEHTKDLDFVKKMEHLKRMENMKEFDPEKHMEQGKQKDQMKHMDQMKPTEHSKNIEEKQMDQIKHMGHREETDPLKNTEQRKQKDQIKHMGRREETDPLKNTEPRKQTEHFQLMQQVELMKHMGDKDKRECKHADNTKQMEHFEHMEYMKQMDLMKHMAQMEYLNKWIK